MKENMLYYGSKIRKDFWWFYMLKLSKIIREKKCKIIQKSTGGNYGTTFIKWGGGLSIFGH